MLADCIDSLKRQTLIDFEVVIVDNSGRFLARQCEAAGAGAVILENQRNAGFGAAVNQACRRSRAPYVATLNDDALADPRWLEELLAAVEPRQDVGMCASCVRLAGENRLDSAGMLLCADGSSKQRGHREPADAYPDLEEVLFPSGSAGLYRRRMLDEIGWFDEDFFLYCEDTDLGLRARWAGWKCLYVPGAVVHHRYSHSAGRASPLKAYYVERNRLFVVIKNFPAPMLLRAPFAAAARYLWHVVSIFQGRGVAAEFRKHGDSAWRLLWFVFRAHLAAVWAWRRLRARGRVVRRSARLTSAEFRRLAKVHSISPKRIAAL